MKVELHKFGGENRFGPKRRRRINSSFTVVEGFVGSILGSFSKSYGRECTVAVVRK